MSFGESDFPWNIEETLNIAEIARLIHMVILKDFAAISEKKFYHVIHSHLTSPVKGGGTLLYAPEGRVKIVTHLYLIIPPHHDHLPA